MLLPYRTADTQLFCIWMRFFLLYHAYTIYTSVSVGIVSHYYTIQRYKYNNNKKCFHFVFFFSFFRLKMCMMDNSDAIFQVIKLSFRLFTLFAWSILHCWHNHFDWMYSSMSFIDRLLNAIDRTKFISKRIVLYITIDQLFWYLYKNSRHE